ncbi:MAG: hypothetical protein ACE5IJ_05840, partial [Thermoplasmata archaeon]
VVYYHLVALAYVSVLVGMVLGLLPLEALVAYVTLPVATRSVIVATRHYDDTLPLAPANAGTIMLHFVFGIVLILSYAAVASNLIALSIISLVLVMFLTTTFISKRPQAPAPHPT